MFGILLLIAGLAVYFVTSYDTLGVIVALIGGIIVFFQVFVFVFVAGKVAKIEKDIRGHHDSFFSDFDSRRAKRRGRTLR